jgi:2-keto-4-pentenoate hydratase/2-oxohepta-3-ene-1,7-dioic acid hydratase in catechol pathway
MAEVLDPIDPKGGQMMLKLRQCLAMAAIGSLLTFVSGQSCRAAEATTPFKLGTFQTGAREFLGLVLQDNRVLEIAAANAAFEKRTAKAARLKIPADMSELIARYESDIGPRLRQIAAANGATTNAPFVHQLSSVRILPPVRPAVILNAGANYPEHAQGIVEQAARAAAAAGQTPAPSGGPNEGPNGRPRAPVGSAPGLWDHPESDKRPDNPYLFLKSPSVVVGADDDVVVPKGREQIDWECEFAVVIGRQAKNVSVADAPNYIFGYSIEFDVSDRGGRNDRKMGGGPDWFIQKNHDTFAPVGPFIVPKEFVPNPMNTRHYFTLNGDIEQDANTGRMEYNIWEMLSYATNVLTMHPGDLISMGTPPGTNIEKSNPRWMRPGDVGVCVVEGIGAQHHHIVGQQ